jgi:hypothetical protein
MKHRDSGEVSMKRIVGWFQKNIRWFYISVGVLLTGVVATQLTKNIFGFEFYFSNSRFQIIVIPLFEIFFFLVLTDIYLHFREKRSKDFRWGLVFLFAIVNLVIASVLSGYYANPERTQTSIFDMLMNLILVVKITLILVSVFCFWMLIKSHLSRIWNYFSLSDGDDLVGEKTRFTILFLAVSFVVGVSLRLIKLDGFPPYIDEYIHTRAALALMQGGPLEWGRAYLTVSLPMYLSYRVFGINLWASRFPIVLINMIAIFPLYFLGKKIHKWVGYIGVVLFIFSPWIIAVSRDARDYGIVPFFLFLAAAVLIDLLDWDGLGVKEYLSKNMFKILVAILILGYITFDHTSVTQIVFASYGVFLIILLLKVIKNKFPIWIKGVILGASLLLLIVVLIRSGLIYRLSSSKLMNLHISSLYWNSFFQTALQQWYFNFSQMGYLILLAAGFFSIRALIKPYKKNDFALLFVFGTFALILIYLTVFLVRQGVSGRLRYGALLEFSYVPVVAFFLFIFYKAIGFLVKKKSLAFGILSVLFLGLFINYQALGIIYNYQGGDNFQITGDRHYIMEPAYEYLIKNLEEQDVLFSDLMARFDKIAGQKLHPLDEIDNYHLVFAKIRDPLRIISQYSQGWVALTSNSNPTRHGFKYEDFSYENKEFHYIGLMGDVYLWHWK